MYGGKFFSSYSASSQNIFSYKKNIEKNLFEFYLNPFLIYDARELSYIRNKN